MTQEFVMYFLLQTTLLNSCSDTHTPISDEDYNMTKGTVILRSPCARVSPLQGRIHRGGVQRPPYWCINGNMGRVREKKRWKKEEKNER